MGKTEILYQKKFINVHACLIIVALMAFPFLGANFSLDNLYLESDLVPIIVNGLLALLTIFMVVKVYTIKIPIVHIKEDELKVSEFVSFVGKITTLYNLPKLLRNKLHYFRTPYKDIQFFETANHRGEDVVLLHFNRNGKIKTNKTGISLLSEKDKRILKDYLKEKQKEFDANFKVYNF